MKVYIPEIDFLNPNRKALFILTRPFLGAKSWENTEESRKKFGVSAAFEFVEAIEKANVFFIPKPINSYSEVELKKMDSICQQNTIKAYGYVSGDLGEDFGSYASITFFRMGGFKSKLSKTNKGFPVSLSDHFERLYQTTVLDGRAKQELAVVGFCGHATLSFGSLLKGKAVFVKENLKRFLKQPFRNDYEPLFASASERAKLLQHFENSKRVATNFIYRNQYRAGAVSEEEKTQTTLEYYDNIKHSDYVLCVRGAGNFSVRLYETLMMGRIPVFVNTDCLLPFEDVIDWKEHVVWVEWKDRKDIASIVADFHAALSGAAFLDLQLRNRKLWKERLSVEGMLRMLEAEFAKED